MMLVNFMVKVTSSPYPDVLVREGYRRTTMLLENATLPLAANLGVFRVDISPGGQVAKHSHQEDLEIFCFLDDCFVGNSKDELLAKAGDVAIVSRGEVHGIRPRSPNGASFITFRIPCNLNDRTTVNIYNDQTNAPTPSVENCPSSPEPSASKIGHEVREAIIGGYGFLEFVENPEVLSLETPFGRSPEIAVGRLGENLVAVVNRHGREHEVPPHKTNNRSCFWALKHLGVQRIFAYSAVGSLRGKLAPRTLVVPHDFLDFSVTRTTFFDGGERRSVAHVDMKNPFCPVVRKRLLDAARLSGIPTKNRGVYACTEGPRFETPAETRALRRLGADIVGMTIAKEATLARESSLCYGVIGVVTNYGSGISSALVSYREITEIMETSLDRIRTVFETALRSKTRQRCRCGSIMTDHGMLASRPTQPVLDGTGA
jgi:5'-methylthioadenosine phosphorylase